MLCTLLELIAVSIIIFFHVVLFTLTEQSLLRLIKYFKSSYGYHTVFRYDAPC